MSKVLAMCSIMLSKMLFVVLEQNPFNMKVVKRAAGTKDQPTMIPSAHDMRLVGCVCHEDAFYVNYMWLYSGEPKRCECGYWFKLCKAEDPFK
jgi:cytochrome c oxidase subunit 5b